MATALELQAQSGLRSIRSSDCSEACVEREEVATVLSQFRNRPGSRVVAMFTHIGCLRDEFQAGSASQLKALGELRVQMNKVQARKLVVPGQVPIAAQGNTMGEVLPQPRSGG